MDVDSPRSSSSRPSTPPSHRPHTPSPATRLASPSIRASQARKLSFHVGADLGHVWDKLLQSFSAVCNDFREEHPLYDMNLAHFFRYLLHFSKQLRRHFSHVGAYDFRHDRVPTECTDAATEALSFLTRTDNTLTTEQSLHYLLNSLPDRRYLSISSDIRERDIRQHLTSGFCRTYHGRAQRRLLAFACAVNQELFKNTVPDRRPYYKGTAIVQSSGTGKSRMVIELGRITPVLYLCIRAPYSTAHSGYPLGDLPIISLIWDQFHLHPFSDDEKAAILIAAWFETLHDRLASLSDATSKSNFLQRLNEYGAEDQEPLRHAFYSSVERSAHAALQGASAGPSYRDVFSARLDGPVRQLSRELRSVLSASGHSRNLPVFVAIDECVLLEQEFLDSIRRVWAHITELELGISLAPTSASLSSQSCREEPDTVCFWLLLLSTSSAASSPIKPQATRTYLRDKLAPPLPTFVGLGFDVLLSEAHPPSTASDALRVSFVKKLGRPLWDSLVPERLWSIATMKLLGGADSFSRGNPNFCFSILASRLALQFSPRISAHRERLGRQLSFAQDAVDKHMRILHKVDGDTVLEVQSPSEPVLAIAASLLMMPSPRQARDARSPGQVSSNRYGSILETIGSESLGQAGINILDGLRGELLARLLLMAAWDAVKSSNATFKSQEFADLRAAFLLEPVPLGEIVSGLVALRPHMQQDLDDHVASVCSRAQSLFPRHERCQAWTHFTHFDVLDERIGEIPPAYLWYCWKRGVAIQMTHTQWGIDGIIPVFVGDLHQPFGACTAVDSSLTDDEAALHMTFVAWEAKNCSKLGRADLNRRLGLDDSAGPSICHPASGTPLTPRGILTILADLGSTGGDPELEKIAETGSLRLRIRGLQQHPNYPCLDLLDIRDAAVSLLSGVSRGMAQYDTHNRNPNPMDIAVLHHGALDAEEVVSDSDEPASPMVL